MNRKILVLKKMKDDSQHLVSFIVSAYKVKSNATIKNHVDGVKY